MRKLILLLFFLIGTVYLILFQTSLLDYPTYSTSDKEVVIVDGRVINYKLEPIINNKDVFLDIYTLNKQMNLDIIYDNNSGVLIMYDSFNNNIIRIYTESNKVKINREKPYKDNLVLTKNGQAYLNLRLIEQYSNYKYKYIQSTNRIIIENKGKTIVQAQSKKSIRVRNEKSIWSNVNDVIQIEEEFYIYKEENDWLYVMTKRGLLGFIKNKDIIKVKEINNKTEKEKKKSIRDKKINLTWEYIYRKTPSVDKLDTIEGLDVISPTWFSLIDEKGNIRDKGSISYVRWAHENNYEVWGLFSNSFDPELTSTIINDSVLRERVINNIVDLCNKYDLDGLNLDFENVYLKDKDMFTQFVKELYPIADQYGLVLSIDITVISRSENWSLFYDRKEIGKVVDYIILMAYDEHWANGGVSGSVASLPWVEYGVSSLLKYVPNDKVILGVPFYTRVWREEVVDGKKKVTSKALSMKSADKLLKQNNATIIWDDTAKQYYGEYRKNNCIYKIWIEDSRSMRERLNIIEKYNLKGIASWRRGFEKKEIWKVIKNSLN